jgi:hypothetical protein
MKAKIVVPTSLSEITLGQYQHFQSVAKNFEEDKHNEFLKQKMLEIFCNVELAKVLFIEKKAVQDISGRINELFTGNYELKRTFEIEGVKFGFIPNLDKITQGEYMDLDTYFTDWKQMHKAMAVLFRPIISERKNNYDIAEYEGTDKFAELMKFTPLDAALGSYVFFYHLGNDLLSSTLNFLQEEAKEVVSQWAHNSKVSGDGITQSIDSLGAKYSALIESQANPFTSALHFSPMK